MNNITAHPVVNVEDPVGKTVGRRKPMLLGSEQSLEAAKRQHEEKAYRKTGIPKGVYRFHSHEEADQWLLTTIAQAAAQKS